VSDQPLSVHAAIAVVMSRMPAIPKGDVAPGNMGGYRFRGIESVTATLQPILGSVGLVIIPQAQSIVIDPAPGQKEAWQDVLVKFDWLLVGPDGSSLTASTYGIGRDHTDKGANKAQTQAYKYLLMHLFCISDSAADSDGIDYSHTGHDDEPIGDPPNVIVFERIKALGKTRPEHAAALKEHAADVDKKLTLTGLADDEWRTAVVAFLDDLDAIAATGVIEAEAVEVEQTTLDPLDGNS
jgi:hypothetical protein